MKKTIILAAFLIGFTAMAAQIVFLRQLIAVFYGNEISIGLILGAWLLWGAVGSWLLGKLADRILKRELLFAILQILLSVVLLGTILVLRNARGILGILPGEIIGFLPMAGFSFLSVSLLCIILGFLFALACRIYPASPNSPVSAIGRIYSWEALGAVCGGCLVSLVLVRNFDAVYIILGLAGLNLLSAASLSQSRLRKFCLILFAILLTLFFSQKAQQLKQVSIEQQWSQFNLLTTRDSIYGNLSLTKQDQQYSFFNNGLYLFTVPDEVSSEEAAHFALLQTTDPRRVLLVGGGMAGLAEEILKHPLTRLDYVELDPAIITLGEQFLPAARLEFLKDHRLKLFHQDGRLFVQQAGSLPNFSHYDNIIIALGDPYTAQINRFYTLEFFQQVKEILAPDGVLSFALSSSENFLNKEQQRFLSSIHQTLRSVFAEVKVIPGDTAYFLATDTLGVLTYDYHLLQRRLEQRKIDTRFVREDYLISKLSPDRIAYLEEKIVAGKKARVNTDFRPISYYYDMLLWSTYFNRPWRKLFSWVSAKKLWAFFGLCYLCILVSAAWSRRGKDKLSAAVVLAVSATGFTELGFQVAILLAFQIIYGYLYYKLGIILSLFMLGLVLGSWLITKSLSRLKDDYGLFLKTQIAISVYPLLLPLIFFSLNKATGCVIMSWLGSNIIFPFLPVISGFVGGVQFPLANKIILKEGRTVGRIAGLTRGMDLLGACLGAVLVSAFLVPILGINQTCLGIALLNAAVLVNLIISRRR